MPNTNLENPQEGQVLGTYNREKFFALAPNPPEGQSENNVETTPEVDIPEEGQLPEGEPEPQETEAIEENFDDWDKEKSVNAYRNLQRKLTERDRLAKELLKEKMELEERLKAYELQNQPISQQPSETVEDIKLEPVELPPDFDYTEAFTNPQSKEAELWKRYNQYLNQVGKYLAKKREQEVKAEVANKQKQWFISQAYKVLNDPKSAEDMYNWFMEVIKNDDFNTLAEAYKLLKQTKASKPIKQVATQQNKNIVVPPAVNPGASTEAETANAGIYKLDHSDIFKIVK